MYKNVASQKLAVYAHNVATDLPETGDAANITAQISKDGGVCAASDDLNPSELDAADAKGVYIFDLLQAETNCDLFILSAVSSTASIRLDPIIVYTNSVMRGTDDAATVAALVVAITAIIDGAGASEKTIVCKDGEGNPLGGASVWLTSDVAGTNVIAGKKYTNAAGEVTFMVTVGITYYVWAKKDGQIAIHGRKWVVT